MKKINIFYSLLVSTVLFCSCANELEVAPPNSITDEQIKEMLASGDKATIEKILGSVANSVVDVFNDDGFVPSSAYLTGYYYNVGQDVMRNLEGNDIVLGNRVLSSSNYGAWEYQLNDFRTVSSTYNYPYWNCGYNGVNTANKLLNYLDDKTVGDNLLLKEYKGRGLIARAYFYNYLMENYQDAYLQGGKDKLGVPLYERYDPSQEYQPRASASDTYAFIKKDLNEAIRLFEEAGIGFTAETYDIDLGIAYFILARVSLWTGDYATCIDCCSKIMDQYPTLIPVNVYGSRLVYDENKVPDISPENNAFLNKAINPEVLFGWDKSKDFGVFGSYMNIFSESIGSTSSYGPTKEAYQCIDNRLYEKMADSDCRKSCFAVDAIGDYAYPTQGIHFIPAYANIKFAATYGLGGKNKKDAGVQDYCLFRTSEALLMLAEAQAMSGNENGAKATLNKLLAARTIADAPALTCDTYPSMKGLSTLEMVQLQWRIEMWGENGREYYNNKRWGIAVDRSSSKNHIEKNVTYSVAQMTLQIPENEMLYNPFCEQN